MFKEMSRKKRVVILAISITALLTGFLVYAANENEIETDVDGIASAILDSTKNSYGLSDNAIALEKSVLNGVETLQNNGISAGLYSIGPLAEDPKVSRALNMVNHHFGSFCASSPTGPETGGTSGGGCPSDPLLQYGDIKISSLLSGTVLDATRTTAAQQFLYNLIPVPDTNFSALISNGTIDAGNILTTSTDSRFPNPTQQFADALTDQAILSMVRQSLGEMIANRTKPDKGDTTMQIMERVAMQRFFSKDWAATLQTLKTEQVAQDQALMQSFQLWMEYQRYRQMERVEALLSAIVIQNYNQAKTAASIIQSNLPPAGQAPGQSATTGAGSSSTVNTLPTLDNSQLQNYNATGAT